jgi:hypothetical protein
MCSVSDTPPAPSAAASRDTVALLELSFGPQATSGDLAARAESAALSTHSRSVPGGYHTPGLPLITPGAASILAESESTISLDLSTGLGADPLGTAWRISPWPSQTPTQAQPDLLR